MKYLIVTALITLIIQGCNVTAQAPAPHKFSWTHTEPQLVLGYKLYCGVATGVYTQNTTIAGGSTFEYIVTDVGLPDGENFCAMTAFNFNGESVFTNEISFNIMNGDFLTGVPVAPGNLTIN